MPKKKRPPYKSPYAPGTPLVYAPNYPKDCPYSDEQKKLIGEVMFFLTEILDPETGYSTGHCIVVHDNKVLQMMHTAEFRKATDKEF